LRALDPARRAAVTLPAGFGKNGLPARPANRRQLPHDHRMLRVAKWVEDALGFEPGIPKLCLITPDTLLTPRCQER